LQLRFTHPEIEGWAERRSADPWYSKYLI